MGKRSNLEREDRDYYKTPLAAVKPLIPFLPKGPFTYAETCAGDGRLVRHITELTGGDGVCRFACDIEPQEPWITQRNALMVMEPDMDGVDMFITNPPWSRDKKSGYLLHTLIEHCCAMRPTWFLFDADHMHTVQAAPYLDRLVAVVAIGRVKWFEDSKMTGKDNCQWSLYHKDARKICAAPMFFGRGIAPPANFANAYLPRVPFGIKEAA